MCHLLCGDQVSFYVVTKCLPLCGEEEVVEISSPKEVVEVPSPEEVEIPPPPPQLWEEDWEVTSHQGVSKSFITVNFIIQKGLHIANYGLIISL